MIAFVESPGTGGVVACDGDHHLGEVVPADGDWQVYRFRHTGPDSEVLVKESTAPDRNSALGRLVGLILAGR